MAKERIWTKNFILTTLAGLFSALVFYVLLTTLAVYSILEFDVTESMAGLAASIFLIGSVIGRALTGRYLGLIGIRRLLIVGGIIFVVFSVLYFLPVGYIALLLLRVLHGIVFGAVQNALQTVVIQFIPKSRLGEGLSYFSLNFILAAGAGPFVGLHVIAAVSYRGLFLLCVGFAVLALLLSLLIRVTEPAYTEEQMKALRRRFLLRDVFDKAALPIACMAILVGACYTSVTAFLEAYSKELHLGEWAPFYFLVVTAVVVVVRPAAGRLLDRKGENVVMYPSLACFVLSLLTLSLAQSGILLLASSVLLALGFGNVLIMGQTIAVKSVPPHRTALANATYFCFSDAGYGLGPLLFGFAATARGFSFMYMTGAVVMAGTILLYYCVHGRNARR
jgi:MFS family permease